MTTGLRKWDYPDQSEPAIGSGGVPLLLNSQLLPSGDEDKFGLLEEEVVPKGSWAENVCVCVYVRVHGHACVCIFFGHTSLLVFTISMSGSFCTAF